MRRKQQKTPTSICKAKLNNSSPQPFLLGGSTLKLNFSSFYFNLNVELLRTLPCYKWQSFSNFFFVVVVSLSAEHNKLFDVYSSTVTFIVLNFLFIYFFSL